LIDSQVNIQPKQQFSYFCFEIYFLKDFQTNLNLFLGLKALGVRHN